MPVLGLLGIAAAAHQILRWPWHDCGIVLLVAGGTAVYAGDRLGKPWLRRSRALRAGAALVVLAALAILAWWGWRCRAHAWPGLAIAAPLALLHTPIKRVPFAKAPLIGVGWAATSVLLPLHRPGWEDEATAAIAVLAGIVAAATVLCDLKDTEGDTRKRARTLPVLLGFDRARTIAALVLICAAPLAVWIGSPALGASACALLVCATRPRLLQRPLLGPTVVDACLVLPLLPNALAWSV